MDGEAARRRAALADVERGVDPQLQYPPLPEEVAAARAYARDHAAGDEEDQDLCSFFDDVALRAPPGGEFLLSSPPLCSNSLKLTEARLGHLNHLPPTTYAACTNKYGSRSNC